jgi:hypothetical protein
VRSIVFAGQRVLNCGIIIIIIAPLYAAAAAAAAYYKNNNGMHVGLSELGLGAITKWTDTRI